MTKKLLALLATLLVVAAACGSTTSQEATEMGDDADTATGAADGGVSDDGESTDSTSADTTTDGAAAEGTEQAMVDGMEGPLGALLFADTVGADDAPSSARFEGRFSMTGAPDSEIPGTVELVVSGGYDQANESAQISMDMSQILLAASEAGNEQIPAGMEEFFLDPIEIIVIGEQGWMKWGLLSMFTGDETGGWLELEADEVADTTEGFGFSSSMGDPTEILDDLAGANASLEDLGVETVNGVSARHWRALVDLETLAAAADEEDLADLEAQFADLEATDFPIDFWIGVDDGLIYRYVLDLSSEAFFEEAEAEDILASTMTFDFYDYGEDLGITPPPADEIIQGDSLFSS